MVLFSKAEEIVKDIELGKNSLVDVIYDYEQKLETLDEIDNLKNELESMESDRNYYEDRASELEQEVYNFEKILEDCYAEFLCLIDFLIPEDYDTKEIHRLIKKIKEVI